VKGLSWEVVALKHSLVEFFVSSCCSQLDNTLIRNHKTSACGFRLDDWQLEEFFHVHLSPSTENGLLVCCWQRVKLSGEDSLLRLEVQVDTVDVIIHLWEEIVLVTGSTEPC